MGAPESGMQAAGQPGADELLGAFKRIGADERRRHEAVLNYWLSIRGDKEFPPLHDLDPLELSDAAPSSILLELISGGHDAEIRHIGEALKGEADAERIIDAPHPSLLSCIAKKLPIVAISRDFLAFEDEYFRPEGKTRCWVTLLPLSAGGAWVDYVYALVSLSVEEAKAAEPVKKLAKKAEPEQPPAAEVEEPVAFDPEEAAAEVEEPVAVEPEEAAAEVEEPAAEIEEPVAVELEEPAAERQGPIEAVAEPDEIAVAEVEEPAIEEIEEPVVAQAEETGAQADELAADPKPEEIAPATQEIAAEEAAAEEPEAPAAVEAEPAPVAKGAGFAKLFDSLAGLTGFYGSQPVKLDPVVEELPVAEEPAEEDSVADEPIEKAPIAEQPVAEAPAEEAAAEEEPIAEEVAEEPAAEAPPLETKPAPAMEGSLQSKLTQVRAKADEVRQARQRAITALHEGLSAAYDFALDAEEAPEEYLRLVEAQGLKIQLRSPMKPVVKLAFDGTCDDTTIKQLEAVLAWALKEELPKGSLGQRIEDAGGIEGLLKAA